MLEGVNLASFFIHALVASQFCPSFVDSTSLSFHIAILGTSPCFL